jgi:hypothetical protein
LASHLFDERAADSLNPVLERYFSAIDMYKDR